MVKKSKKNPEAELQQLNNCQLIIRSSNMFNIEVNGALQYTCAQLPNLGYLKHGHLLIDGTHRKMMLESGNSQFCYTFSEHHHKACTFVEEN